MWNDINTIQSYINERKIIYLIIPTREYFSFNAEQYFLYTVI